MSKRHPEMRRDSMNSYFSGGSSQGSPPPLPVLPQQPQQHQPTMTGQRTRIYVDKNGRKWTEAEVQMYFHHRRAAVMRQRQAELAHRQAHAPELLTPEQVEQARRYHQQQLMIAGQNPYMPSGPVMYPNAIAPQPGFHSGQQSVYASQFYPPTLGSNMPNHPQMRTPQQHNYAGLNAYSPPNAPSHPQGADEYQLSARDMQAMARASPTKPHPTMGHANPGARGAQQAKSMPLDPQVANLSTAPTRPAAKLPSQAPTKPATSAATPRLPTPTTRPSSALIPPPHAGVKRPSPGGQDAYMEGPLPKRAMFSTAPPSRPSSAQGIAAPLQQKPQHNIKPRSRLNKEAVGRGVHNLDIPEQKACNAGGAEGLQKAGHAAATASGSGQEKQKTKSTTIAQKRENQQTMKNKHASGAKVSMGAPARPASAMGQAKKQAVIDLTVEDIPRHRSVSQHAASPQTNQVGNVNVSGVTEPTAPILPNLCLQALEHGVHMSDVEYGSNIQTAMEGWLYHHKDIAAAQSLLDPPPEKLQRLRRENASASHATTNEMDAAHAKALKLPTNFNMRDTLNKVRNPSYNPGYSGNDSEMLPAANKEVLDMCLRDADGDLRAPEEHEMSEEGAHVRYELFKLAAERNDAGRARWVGDRMGAANWR